MAEQKESSVLFSLKELMSLEEDRIKQEEGERRRQVEAAEQARADAERRSREQAEAHTRAEAERVRQDEVRTREEAARLEAIRHAEMEKARLDAENAARLEAMRHQQEHEQKLTALKEDKGKKNLLFIAAGVAFLLVVAIVGGGLAIKSQNDAREATELKHQQELAEQKAAAEGLKHQLEEQTAAVGKLEGDVAKAKNDQERAEALAKLTAARNAQNQTRSNLQHSAVGGGPAKAGGAAKPCACQPGDPLCSCLP